MAKEKKEESTIVNPQQQLESFLKGNEKDHLNFEHEDEYKICPSSLTLAGIMGGGLGTGSSRFIGYPTGGKTSCALDFMFAFLKKGKGYKGIYVKAEGRLGSDMRERSGIAFTDDFAKWEDGTCFIYHCNVYESVFSLIKELITNNPTKTKYFFIVDSINMLGKREDLAKAFEDANQVAAGALLTSDFFRKTAMAMSRRGHICVFISQVRDTISINAYSAPPPRQGKSSGAHSLEHQGEWVIDFQPRYKDDIIRKNPADDKSDPIGHYCKINIIKSPNEKYNFNIRYPIKYGRTGGTSIWVEREIGDIILGWGLASKAGAGWITFTPSFITELKDQGFTIPEKIQGLENLYDIFEKNKELTAYLFNKFSVMVGGK